MKRYDYMTPTTQQAPPIELQQPRPPETERAHLFSLAAGVWLPLTQAIMTGLVIGGAGAVYASLLKSPQALKIGAAVGIGVAVIAWLLFLARWLALTQPMRFERITGLDINQDGVIGQPPKTLKVMITSEDRKQGIIAEVPHADKLPTLARGLLRGEPLSERHWSGAGALFSQNEFRAIRDVFLARGLMRWVNPGSPKQGLELTPAGRAAIRAIASSPTLPDSDTED